MTDPRRTHDSIYQIPAMEYRVAADAILNRIIYAPDQVIPWPQTR